MFRFLMLSLITVFIFDVSSQSVPDFLTLSISQKIGQLQWLALRPPIAGSNIHTLTPEVRKLMLDIQPGGIILFQENLSGRDQLIRFIRDLQALSAVPLLISLDEEGGGVSRLGNISAMRFRRRPSASGWASLTPEAFRREIFSFATDIKAVGINLNLAPVADLNLVDGNPLRYRSFGKDPVRVSALVSDWVRGFREVGVASTLKHFPGLGSTRVDTHVEIVELKQSMQEWQGLEGRVFREGINIGAEVLMVAHVTWPSVEPEGLPVTFSSRILKGILRDQWRFQGLIITDALDMGAVTHHYTPGEASLKALRAGADVAVMSIDPYEVKEAIEAAWGNDPDFRVSLEASVQRQLRIKTQILRVNTQ